MEPHSYRNDPPRVLRSDLAHLVSLSTAPDGNCLFHSVLNALWQPYRELDSDWERRRMAQGFRVELAQYLDAPDPETHKSVYNSLMRGNLPAAARERFDRSLTLVGMKRSLLSFDSVNVEMVELLTRYLDANIYIVWHRRGANLEPYPMEANMELYRAERKSILVFYRPANGNKRDLCAAGHYETVARQHADDHLQTVFAWNDPLIVGLARRVEEYVARAQERETETPRVFLHGREVVSGEEVGFDEIEEKRRQDAGRSETPIRANLVPVPGRPWEMVKVTRNGTVVLLLINIPDGRFSRGKAIVAPPSVLPPGRYSLKVYDQGAEKFDAPEEPPGEVRGEAPDLSGEPAPRAASPLKEWGENVAATLELVSAVEFRILPSSGAE